MRDNLHRCYSCTAEAMTLCQGCAAKSCLDHLTAKKLPYSHALLCTDCLAGKRQETAILALWLFVGFIVMLAAVAGRVA